MPEWYEAAPIIEEHGGVLVVREDLLDGGSKIRFLPHIVAGAKEIVFGGPFCGGAPYALSVYGRRKGVAVTLFYAKRKEFHWRQKAAFRNGSTLFQVPAGRMSVVQHRARSYAAQAGALFLPLGFDIPGATAPFEAVMARVAAQAGPVDEVWCATGSGMLARCLGRAFPQSRVFGVTVGLASRNQKQAFPPNVELLPCHYDFAEETPANSPFPSCGNYDRKAWEQLMARGRGRRLFWNVLGDQPPK
jgi:hypothetical protein